MLSDNSRQCWKSPCAVVCAVMIKDWRDKMAAKQECEEISSPPASSDVENGTMMQLIAQLKKKLKKKETGLGVSSVAHNSSKGSALCGKTTKSVWTDQDVQKMIDLVEERYVLWDTTHKEYHDRRKKSEALEEIADQLGINQNAVLSKWRNLRGQFGREVNKVNRTKSGQGTDERYRSTWRYFDQLTFLSCSI